MKGFSPLIPGYISNRLLSNFQAEIKAPMVFTEDAAVLFTDICSFTKLTDFFSSSGHYGVEGITALLDEYFSYMIGCIHNNCGSLVKLGGDSILAFFPGDLETAVSNMKRCGKDMLAALERMNISINEQFGTTIKFRGGGAYGSVTTNLVGDAAYHLDYYFVGRGIEKALAMEESALPGTISYDPDIAAIGTDESLSPQSASEMYDRLFMHQLSPPEVVLAEKLFISPKVRERVIGQFHFKAELKNAAIIFINPHVTDDDGIEQAGYINNLNYQEMYRKLQQIVYSLDGNINKIDVNDKGYMIIITFGVPNIHFDDIERAFVCCYRLSRLSVSNIGLRMGITYSNIFAGNFGSSQRFEYGIIGNGVNAAARLMQNAASGQITFSKEILSRISSRFESEYVSDTTVKGFAEPIQIYRLIGELPENWKALSNQYTERTQVVYQEQTKEIINSLITGSRQILRIYAKRGTGKSFIIYKLLEQLRQHFKNIDIVILDEFNTVGKLDFIFKLISKKLQLSSLEKDLCRILEYCEEKSISIDRQLFSEQLITFSSGRSLSSAETAEQCDISLDTTVVRGQEEQLLRNEIFFSNLQDIIISLLTATDILVIDNYHWIDSLSGKILNSSVATLTENGMKLIITADTSSTGTNQDQPDEESPEIEEPVRDLIDCFDIEKCELLLLTDLNAENAKKLITAELTPKTTYINDKGETVTKSSWVANVSDSAIEILNRITSGNPFFLVEIARIIKTSFNFQEDMLTEAVITNLQREGIIPATMESIFLRQFEGLNNRARYLLMIASIIGSSFSMNDLMVTDKEQLQEDIMNILGFLNDNHIIDQKDLNPEIEYIFTNSIMRESIYRTILMGEKRKLHERIAAYYEEKYKDSINNYVEIIAGHYIQTDSNEKKIYYCRRAAKKNSLLYCLDESCHYLDNAIEATSDECLKLELEMDKIIILLLQGKIFDVEKRLARIEERVQQAKEDTATLAGLCEYLLYVKVKTKIYKGDYVGLLQDIETASCEISNREFKNSIESYRLDSLRFLNRHEEFLKQAKLLEEQALAENDKMQQAIISSLLGQYYLDLSDYQNSKAYFEKKLAAATAINDQIQKRQALNSIGVTYSRAGDKAKARDYFEEAKAIAEKLGDRNGLTRILMNLGIIYKNEGSYDKAMDCYYKSLRLTKLTMNREQEAIILYNIGEAIYTQFQDYEKALTFLNKSLKIAEELQDTLQMTFCYDAIGDMSFYLGKIDEAEEIYLKNLEIQNKIADIEGVAHTYGNLGNIAKVRKDYKKAFDFYTKQQQLLQENGDKDGEGRSWFNMAMVDIEQDKYQDAKVKLFKALELFTEISAKYYIDTTNEWIAKLDEEINKTSI